MKCSIPSQGLNPGLPLPHCKWIFYQVSHQESSGILEWVSIPSPEDLPDPGIESGSPALQVDSLPAELPGKLYDRTVIAKGFGVSFRGDKKIS